MVRTLRDLVMASCLCLVWSGFAWPQGVGLVVDGRLDDPVWRNLPAERLVPSEEGVPAAMGGEIRSAIAGRYLYVSARLPEPSDRITARVIGRNPHWEDEDLLRIVAGPDIGYTDREVKINPLGAYSVERNGQLVHPGSEKYLVATHIGEQEWTVELAFPLNLVGAPTSDRILLSVGRIRAARPGTPPLRWHWPEYGPVAKVPVASGDWNLPAPELRLSLNFSPEPPIAVGRVGELPPMESRWQEAGWRDAPVRRLLRDEPRPRLPRFPTELKLLHDGRTLAVLANCREPGPLLTGESDALGRPGPEDSFQVYLATSGSAYVRLAVNPSGIRQDATGVTGGPRVSRPREWASGARSLARRTADGWLVRIDIPLEKAAEALGETSLPPFWRVLFLRSRPGRDGEALETSVLPVVESDTPLCPARYRRLVLAERASAEDQAAKAPLFETRVLSSAERKQMDLAQMLIRHIRARVQKAIDQESQDWAKITTREEWERFRDPRIQALASSLGEFPPRGPLQVRVTKEFVGNGYRRQDLVYLSRPGLWVTANLYLPEAPRAGMPGIVIIHSHHRPRTQAELQDMGILWARAGCAVLIMDQMGHGERIQQYPWNRDPYHSRYMMGMQLYLAGESLVKWIVWDVMRGIDLLLERRDVDPQKIILLGAVAGGGDPAAVAAALDPRIAAVAPFNFVRTGQPNWGEWESTRCLRRTVADGFFAWVINASVAPRRLVYAVEMGWENYRTHEAWERYQRVFGFYGVTHHLDEAHGFGTFPGPGECTNIGPAQRKTLYPELNRWFGIPIPPQEPDDRRPEAELASLTPALAAELQMKDLHELAAEAASRKLAAARAKLNELAPERRREWLRANLAKKLGDVEPEPQPEAITHWKRQWNGATAEGITLEVEAGVVVPLVLLRPEGAKAPPVVVALSEGGKERIFDLRKNEIDSLLRAGVAVCLPDVRGTGETSPDPRRGLSGEGDSPAATEFMLGNTLLGARLKDLRTVLAYLRGRADLDRRRISLWGDTYAPVNPARIPLDEVPGWQIGPWPQRQAEPMGAILAVLGALYEEDIRAVAAYGGLVSYMSVLGDNFTYVPNDIIVPGVLEVADLSDVAAALAPRPLLMEGLVDGRNRLVDAPEVRREYESAFAAYRGAPGNLAIREAGAAPAWIEWLLGHR